MTRRLLIRRLIVTFTLVIFGSFLFQSVTAQTITLHSRLKYRQTGLPHCFNLEPGGPCEVKYGTLVIGDYLDWFQTGGGADSRTLIKDLGKRSWNDKVKVAVIEPLAKLKPGEQRRFVFDASGNRGSVMSPQDLNVQDLFRGSIPRETIRLRDYPERGQVWTVNGPIPAKPQPAPQRAKVDPKVKVPPTFIKAVVGHIYAIHVVDNRNDYYALFRVDELTPGDNCKISWKLVPAPK